MISEKKIENVFCNITYPDLMDCNIGRSSQGPPSSELYETHMLL